MALRNDRGFYRFWISVTTIATFIFLSTLWEGMKHLSGARDSNAMVESEEGNYRYQVFRRTARHLLQTNSFESNSSTLFLNNFTKEFSTGQGPTMPSFQQQCRDVHQIDGWEAQCNHTLITPDCALSGGYFWYINFVYCKLGPEIPLAMVILVLWWLFCFTALAMTADSFFCPDLVAISRNLRLSPNIAGVTFLAFGNGSPDVFAAIAALAGSPTMDTDLAVGAIIGAGLFDTTIVAGAIAIMRPFTAMKRPFLRDLIFYTFGVYWLFYILWNKKIRLIDAAGFISAYAVYATFVIVSGAVFKRQRQQLIEKQEAEKFAAEQNKDKKSLPTEDENQNGIIYDGDVLSNVNLGFEAGESSPDPITSALLVTALVSASKSGSKRPSFSASSISSGRRSPSLAIDSSTTPDGKRASLVPDNPSSRKSSLVFTTPNGPGSRKASLVLDVPSPQSSRRSSLVPDTQERGMATLSPDGAASGTRSRTSSLTIDAPRSSPSSKRNSLVPDSVDSERASLVDGMVCEGDLQNDELPNSLVVLADWKDSKGGSPLPTYSEIFDYPVAPVMVTVTGPDASADEGPAVRELPEIIITQDEDDIISDAASIQEISHQVTENFGFDARPELPSADMYEISDVKAPRTPSVELTTPPFQGVPRGIGSTEEAEIPRYEFDISVDPTWTVDTPNENAPTMPFWLSFLNAINPINLDEWPEMSWYRRAYEVVKAPSSFCVGLTSPVVDHEVEITHKWNRWLRTFQVAVSPTFFVWLIGVGTNKFNGVFPVYGLTLLISAALAPAVFFTSKNNEPPVYHWAFAYAGFVTAICWLYVISNEVVNTLQTFGVVLNISNTILGATLLAWGNCVGDFISDTSMARRGLARSGFSACFGGPFFNLMLGIGIPSIIVIVGNYGQSVPVSMNGMQLLLTSFTMFSTSLSLVWMAVTNFKVQKVYGITLYCVYLTFFVLLITSQTGAILSNFTPF